MYIIKPGKEVLLTEITQEHVNRKAAFVSQ